MTTTTTAPAAALAHNPALIACAVRAAGEGVPVGVIARILAVPYHSVLNCLTRAQTLGALVDIPRADWASTSHAPRAKPTAPVPPAELEFLCRRLFRLTNLEAGFLVVLLRTVFAEKEKLHAVIEQQRASRPLRPDRQETTDPKMVDVMICKLRKKLSALDPELVIQTSWGKGYFLDHLVKSGIYRILDVGVGDFAHAPPQRPTAGAADPSGERGRSAAVSARS